MTMEAESHGQQAAMNSHRFLSTCNRHPDVQVTGFCASCLRERLAGLDNANGRRSSTSSSVALKTIFIRPAVAISGRPSSSAQHQNGRKKNSAMTSSSRSELRRCKSFVGGPRDAALVEPQRKSCDARVRSTLSTLFHKDDRDSVVEGGQQSLLSSSAATANVFAAGEIKVAVDSAVLLGTSKDELEDVRPMKDHIDLDSYTQTKKTTSRDIKEIAGSFWLAASVFSKKLQKWRRKHKPNKGSAGDDGINKPSALRPEEKKTRISATSCRFRDSQSEIAVDAFGRRSCDMAPRFSLDAGRTSFDDRRCSLDEPRASWDGCLINTGRSSAASQIPAKLEDPVQRSDGLIPVEEEDTKTPGCSAQTRDYYSDSSSRRRRSLDRSSSSRRHSVVLCDTKPASSNDHIPEIFHWSKLDRESEIWGSNSLREDCSGSVDSTFIRDPMNIPPVRKSRLWGIWEFIHRRNGRRAGEPQQEMKRSFSETWPEIRATGSMRRSSSSVKARGSFSTKDAFSSTLKGGLESTKQKRKKEKKMEKSMEFVLDKSRSARYSPSHFDSGLLRFYLTPTRGNWRSGMLAKSKFSSPRSFTSSLLRLY